MSEHVIYNKTKLCFTEVSDFTDFQGIGADPMYKRYDSVQAVLRTSISEPYKEFLAQPLYNADEDVIEWYVENWKEHPVRLVDLTGGERERYKKIMDDTVQHYRSAALKLENEDLMILGGAMKFVSEDMIFCYDNKVVMVCWGMRYDTKKHLDLGSLMHAIPTKTEVPVFYQVIFKPGVGGSLEGESSVFLKAGTKITADMVPTIKTNPDYTFTAWDKNPVDQVVSSDMVFTAQYDKKVTPTVPPIVPPIIPPVEPPERVLHKVRFVAGDNGSLSGTSEYDLPKGAPITAKMVPVVNAKKGYKFTGWDVNPVNYRVNGDKVFTARYKEKKNWWAAIWPWLWKILLALLLLLLLILLLRTCGKCTRTPIIPHDTIITPDDQEWIREDPRAGDGGIYNPGDPYTPVPTPPEYSDILPPNQGVLPPISDDDPIRDNPNPGDPVIIENKLNVLMENEDKSIMDLARDFKNKYPGDQYKVVYYDDVVKRMQIEVPVEEREAIKQRLPQEFAPEYELYVFDESMFESFYRPTDPAMSSSSKTWYLDAINAFTAWDITTGSDSVVVAVVDNGFTLEHKELKGKIVMPYNVWSHDQTIFAQDVDHGTHVAGTAVAFANNEAGLCGIAPNCRLMPIQVADRQGRMTTTSILDGILYALYQGAEVVNVSLGVQMGGLDQYPEEFQQELIDSRFKEEQRLWEEVSKIAELHKSTIVVAAGNDNVLAGIDALHRPENIIVVSALDKSGRSFGKADFSNYGEYSTVSAPGVDIYSCCHNSYEIWEGTSMASPVVAGAVALMKSLNKNLTTAQIVCILQSTGKSVSDKVGPMLMLDKALQKVKSNNFNDCNVANPVPSHGDVEITLKWNNYNDLDLHCKDPNGEIIYYKNKTSRSGGILEIDKNDDASPGTNTPIEHIFWPTNGAPNGRYVVNVNYFAKRDDNVDETPYTVTVKYGDKTENYSGTLSSSNRNRQICVFTLNR